MTTTGFYPVLMTDDVAATARFYREVFAFEVTYSSDWYVSLRRDDAELAILDRTHETVPATHRAATAAGVLLNLEVDDVAELHETLTREFGIAPALSLRDEDFGQRHFIVRAPDGVLVDVIQPIPPTAEFAALYADDALPR